MTHLAHPFDPLLSLRPPFARAGISLPQPEDIQAEADASVESLEAKLATVAAHYRRMRSGPPPAVGASGSGHGASGHQQQGGGGPAGGGQGSGGATHADADAEGLLSTEGGTVPGHCGMCLDILTLPTALSPCGAVAAAGNVC